jgi:hypothetical protein
MSTIVLLLGLLIVIMGGLIVLSPVRMRPLVGMFRSRSMTVMAASLRVVLGIVLISAAPECRLAPVVYLLGFLMALAGVALIFVGQARVEAMINWWLRLPTGTARLWGFVAVLFGLVLVYAGT